MGIQDLGAIGEFVGSIAVLATLIYVAIQIRQSTVLARAQMAHDAWLHASDADIAMMGERPAAVLAKLDLGCPLTDEELKVADVYFRQIITGIARIEYTNALGLELYSPEQSAKAFAPGFDSPVGRLWWSIWRRDGSSGAVIAEAPTISSRIDEILRTGEGLAETPLYQELRERVPRPD